MIIAFEGIDNAGKTSITEKLVGYFECKGKQAIISKELTTTVGDAIKECFKNEGLSPISKAFLFAADRQIRIEKLEQEIKEGKIIIFDRYIYSAIAYRESEGIDGNWVKVINKNVPYSDICIYIDITPEESIKRNTNSKFNIHYTLDELTKIRNIYLKYVGLKKMIMIDGMRTLDDIFNDIIVILEKEGI